MRALILAPFAERYLRRLRRSLEVVYDSWMESRRLHSPEELAALGAWQEGEAAAVTGWSGPSRW
jgi:hypothetical protein